MPYHKNHNVLLIHVPKTAGIFVARSLGLDFFDYYQSLRPSQGPAIQQDREQKGSGVFRALKKKFFLEHRNYIGSQNEALIGPTKLSASLQNLTFNEIIQYGFVSLNEAKEMKKLMLVRHPFERFLSLYSYWRFAEAGFSIDDVIDLLFDCNTILIDRGIYKTFSPMLSYIQNPYIGFEEFYTLRNENLIKDLNAWSREHDVPLDIPKSKINTSESFNCSLSKTQQIKLVKYYSADFHFFNYQ